MTPEKASKTIFCEGVQTIRYSGFRSGMGYIEQNKLSPRKKNPENVRQMTKFDPIAITIDKPLHVIL